MNESVVSTVEGVITERILNIVESKSTLYSLDDNKHHHFIDFMARLISCDIQTLFIEDKCKQVISGYDNDDARITNDYGLDTILDLLASINLEVAIYIAMLDDYISELGSSVFEKCETYKEFILHASDMFIQEDPGLCDERDMKSFKPTYTYYSEPGGWWLSLFLLKKMLNENPDISFITGE